MQYKVVSQPKDLVFKDYYKPFIEKDKPSWAKHCLLHVPIPKFEQLVKDNTAAKLDIFSINDAIFNEIFVRFSDLDFTPDLFFTNAGDLQNWQNFHIHAIAEARVNLQYWGIFEGFLEKAYGKTLTFGYETFPVAVIEGTRSFTDFRSDKVYAVDISSQVIENCNVSYSSLVKTINFLINELQQKPAEMGTLVIIPKNNSYQVVYILKPTIEKYSLSEINL